MAFSNEKLSDIVQVSTGNTVAMITVANSKKVYVRSIAAFDVTGAGSTANVYVVPNGGSVSEATQMFRVNLSKSETALIEPIYPIVLDTTGDSLRVGAASSTVNFFIVGDKEA
jgi:hypothetical protein